jgi:hypothetical protein
MCVPSRADEFGCEFGVQSDLSGVPITVFGGVVYLGESREKQIQVPTSARMRSEFRTHAHIMNPLLTSTATVCPIATAWQQ